MKNFLATPGSRLVLLVMIATLAVFAVFYLTVMGWDSAAGGQGVFAAILAQDLRFWVQIATGLGAFVISAWIWALKPRNFDVTLFALGGLATLIFTLSMAPAGAVNVSIAPDILIPLYYINAGGASLFGIVMTVLLLRYPVRLPGHRVLIALAVVGFGGWTLSALFGPLEGLMVVHTITFAEMMCMIAAVIGQYFATRTQPKERAIAIWLGISIIVGSGIFIALVAAPIALGFPPLVDERYAFSSFLLVYIGMAFGLTRYRLFELGEWAFYLLFYVTGALLLVAIDIALIFLMSLDAAASIGVSLLVVALVYLPTRDLLWRQFLQRKPMEEHMLFQSIVDVAFEPDGTKRVAQWGGLFTQLFDPLEIIVSEPRDNSVAIQDDGIGLFVPAVADMPAITLLHPWRGRGLFGPRHLRTADHLIDIMRRAEAGRRAYDLGVSEERTRIARDMHDNIGAQLLSALHSSGKERKNLMIGQTLSDLRDIIRNATRPGLPMEEALADLRAETTERFELADIAVTWKVDGESSAVLSPDTAHALRSVIREAVSNIIRHSGARTASVQAVYSSDEVSLVLADDGRGFDTANQPEGIGLRSMKDRMIALGGAFDLENTGNGTVLTARLPLRATPKVTTPVVQKRAS